MLTYCREAAANTLQRATTADPGNVWVFSHLRTRFFFRAEEGIRDGHVTAVQTCALPILRRSGWMENRTVRPRCVHMHAAGVRWPSTVRMCWNLATLPTPPCTSKAG